MTDRDKIIDRARKLRALSGSTNAHEADVARTRLGLFMREHQISDNELQSAAEASVGEWPVEGVDFTADWRLGLLTVIAMRYGCKTLRVFEGPTRTAGAVVGPKDLAEIVTQLFRHFGEEVSKRCMAAWQNEQETMHKLNVEASLGERSVSKDDAEDWEDAFESFERQWSNRMRATFVDSFCRGATISLQDRILSGDLDVMAVWKERNEAEEEKKRNAEAVRRAKASLVRVDPRAVAKKHVDSHMRGRPVERFSGYGRASDREAFSLGKVAGANIAMPGMRQDVLEAAK